MPVYLKKQRIYRRKLSAALSHLKPDITVSLLRREINFITSLKDGSKKIGELHVNRKNYRNFEKNESNFIKELFAKLWMKSLVRHLKKLDKFVVLSEEDRANWPELQNVKVISNPLPFQSGTFSDLNNKRITAAGRYTYQKDSICYWKHGAKSVTGIRTGNYIYMAKETRLHIKYWPENGN